MPPTKRVLATRKQLPHRRRRPPHRRQAKQTSAVFCSNDVAAPKKINRPTRRNVSSKSTQRSAISGNVICFHIRFFAVPSPPEDGRHTKRVTLLRIRPELPLEHTMLPMLSLSLFRYFASCALPTGTEHQSHRLGARDVLRDVRERWERPPVPAGASWKRSGDLQRAGCHGGKLSHDS